MRTLPRIISVFLSIIACFVILLNVIDDPNHIDEEFVSASTMPVVVEDESIVFEMVHYSEPTKEIWPYPITQEEIDLIALVTMAEAEGETELGKRLVIDTILNRMDDPHFPDTVHDVIYQANAFSSMCNGRIDRCCIMPEIVELVKEGLLNRTNYECVFFTAGDYSKYGEPMFQECCHYFSSYD